MAMKMMFFCPYWGQQHVGIETFAKKVKAAGYEGVEMPLPLDESDRERIVAVLRDHDLALIAQHHETHLADWQAHRQMYEGHLRNLAAAQPFLINAHTGKDYFSFEQNATLIELAKVVAEETGVRILHETHRGRFSFAAHVTRRFLESLEDLTLTLDLSHWCNVAESMLEDQTEAVELALSRCAYFHARVGFAEGPQITDPRAPEWQDAVVCHLQWWDQILEYALQRGDTVFPIAPEFGPFPYLQHLPFTQMPLANQWEINCYMKDLLTERYQSKLQEATYD
jgi:sugar phosphate isomerase/epimerase